MWEARKDRKIRILRWLNTVDAPDIQTAIDIRRALGPV
jgi:hypothetical protein